MTEIDLPIDELLDNFYQAESELDDELLDEIVDDLSSWGNIYIACDEKSKFLGNSFAFKLRQSTLSPNVVEETCLKEFENKVDIDDSIFIITKNGEDDFLLDILEITKQVGAKIYVLTSSPKSSLASNADELIFVNGKNEDFFEINTSLILNCIFSKLFEYLGDGVFSVNLAKCITVN